MATTECCSYDAATTTFTAGVRSWSITRLQSVGSSPRHSPIVMQAYQQLELTLLHLLEKHVALKDENVRLSTENHGLQVGASMWC